MIPAGASFVLSRHFFDMGGLMKILFFLIWFVIMASPVYAVTMGAKASTLYIFKGESVTFTFTFDPGEEDENLLPTKVTIKLKLDHQDDYAFSKEIEIQGGDTITVEHPQEFILPGYYDAEPHFEWITVNKDGDEKKNQKKLNPIRVGVANWIFSAGDTLGCIESTPAISQDGSTLYVGSEDHLLYAVDTEAGTEKWSYPTGGPITSTPAIDSSGKIYFGSTDGFVYCLDPNGNLVWKHNMNGPVYSSPALDEDGDIRQLYIGSTDANLYALKLDENGKEAWPPFTTGGKITSSPVIGFDGTVYIGSLDHFLYAVNPMTGKSMTGDEEWLFPFDAKSEIYGSPALDRDGTIFLGTASFGGGISDQNGIFALSHTGEKKWFVQHGAGFSSSPVIDPDGVVCIGSNSNKMYGINRHGDSLANFKKFSDDHAASPAMGSNDYIFCAAKDGIFYGLNRKKGDSLNGREEKWKYPLDLPVTTSSPVIKNGYVYVGTCGYNRGSIYSFFCDKDVEKTDVNVHEDSPWPQFRGCSRNSGKTAFTAETVAPEVVSVSPSPGETRLKLSQDFIEIHFSRPMDPSTLFFESESDPTDVYYGFTLEPFDSGPEELIPDWDKDKDPSTCTIPLPEGEAFKPYITYTATILSKARAADMDEDSENDTILSNYTWSFSFMDEEEISYDHSPSSSCFISNIMGNG
jgi:outer membrane protein assembly factor BamB